MHILLCTHVRDHARTPLPATANAAMPPQTVLLEIPTHKEGKAVEKAEARTRTPRFFKGAQQRKVPCLCRLPQAPQAQIHQMHSIEETSRGDSSSSTVSQCASVSRHWQAAQTHPIPHDISVQGVESLGMELSSGLRHRRTEMLTPYRPSAWRSQLERHGLLGIYHNLYHSLMHGFDLGIPSISQTYVPANSPSIYKLPREYEEIVDKEFQKGRSIGPFLRADLESILGPFQSSPLSLVPKPGKPGKFCAVHDFSHLCQRRQLCSQHMQ